METVEDDLDEENQDEAPYTQSPERPKTASWKLSVDQSPVDVRGGNRSPKSPGLALNVSCLQKSIVESQQEETKSDEEQESAKESDCASEPAFLRAIAKPREPQLMTTESTEPSARKTEANQKPVKSPISSTENKPNVSKLNLSSTP